MHGEGYKYKASPTGVLGELRKIGLEFWFKFNTAAFCDEEGKKGREAGTGIHELIEKNINGEEITIETDYAEEVTTGYESFLLFRKEHPEIKLLKSEILLNCDKYKMSGMMDCLGEENKDTIIVDWKGCKTKKGVIRAYPTMTQQVAFYKVMHELQFNSHIKKALVVLLARNEVKYKIVEVSREELEDVFDNVCLPVLSIYNYLHKNKEKKK